MSHRSRRHHRRSDSESSSSSSSESEMSDLDHEVFERKVGAHMIKNVDEAESAGIRVSETKTDLSGGGYKASLSKKPFAGALEPPTNVPPNNPSAPDQDLELEWVYGCRQSAHCRENIALNTKGEIVYPAAGVVVAFDPIKDTQKIFQGHDDDVVCLAQNPANPDIVATGQVATIKDGLAQSPKICVWNTVSNETWVLENAGQRAVRSVSFSPSGKYLASVGDDNQHEVTVWDWESKKKVCVEKGDTNTIFCVEWNVNSGKDEEFWTAGKRHVKRWSFSGRSLENRNGILGRKFDTTTFTAITFSDKGYACVGGQNGKVYIFVDGTCKKAYDLHKGSVYTIDFIPGGLVTGGRDGVLQILDKKVKTVNKLRFPAQIRSVLHSERDNCVVVGCSNSCIYRIEDPQDAEDIGRPLVSGHFDGELWGLCPSPVDPTKAISVGEDNLLCLIDLKETDIVKMGVISTKRGKRRKRKAASTSTKFPENQCARAVDWSNDGKLIAVGTNSGFLKIFDGRTLRQIKELDLNEHGKRKVKGQRSNWIQALKFDPSGELVAVGTHGSVICLVDVQSNTCVGKLTSHNAAISHLDWSMDGKHIRSNCIAYELLFHDINRKNPKKSKQNRHGASELRDTEWATHDCVFAWDTIGVFDEDCSDGTDVNCVDVNPAKTLIAYGDDFGYVKLSRYPGHEMRNIEHVKTGHASHVMSVRFTKDGKYLLSAGGGDQCVLQWKVVDRH